MARTDVNNHIVLMMRRPRQWQCVGVSPKSQMSFVGPNASPLPLINHGGTETMVAQMLGASVCVWQDATPCIGMTLHY